MAVSRSAGRPGPPSIRRCHRTRLGSATTARSTPTCRRLDSRAAGLVGAVPAVFRIRFPPRLPRRLLVLDANKLEFFAAEARGADAGIRGLRVEDCRLGIEPRAGPVHAAAGR